MLTFLRSTTDPKNPNHRQNSRRIEGKQDESLSIEAFNFVGEEQQLAKSEPSAW